MLLVEQIQFYAELQMKQNHDNQMKMCFFSVIVNVCGFYTVFS